MTSYMQTHWRFSFKLSCHTFQPFDGVNILFSLRLVSSYKVKAFSWKDYYTVGNSVMSFIFTHSCVFPGLCCIFYSHQCVVVLLSCICSLTFCVVWCNCGKLVRCRTVELVAGTSRWFPFSVLHPIASGGDSRG